jgi:multiple sugar transport system ATP-binding protein
VARVDAAGSPRGARVALGIRPEHALLGGVAGQPNTLAGTVAFVEQLGESTCIHVRLDGGQLFTVRERGDARSRVGDTVTVRCDPGDVHVFREDGRSFARTAAAPQALARA